MLRSRGNIGCKGMKMARKTTTKNKYALLIFAGCCCLGASGMALVSNLKGVYLVAGAAHMGLTPTEWSLWGVAVGIVGIFVFPMWGQLLKKHCRACVTIGAILEIIAVLLFTVVINVPGIILIGILYGIALPVTFLLTIPTLITNWFAPKVRGRYLGIAMACSGFGTFVWAPLFTWFLNNLGYTTCYIINAVFIAVLILPWALFVFKFTPEEMGLQQYGYDPEEADADESAQASCAYGMEANHAFKTAAFWFMFCAIGFVSIGMGYNSVLAAYAGEALSGTDLAASASMLGAWMISAAAAGNFGGKAIFGFVSDKLGLRATTFVFIVAVILAFLLWIIFPTSVVPMFVAAFLLGTINGISSVGNPMIVRQLFGGLSYEKIYSRLSIASSVVGGFSTTFVTAVAAATGSYVTAMWSGVVLLVIVGAFTFLATRYFGKLKWDKTPETDAAVSTAVAEE